MNLQYLEIVLFIISAAFNVVYAANAGLPTTTSAPPSSPAFKIVTVQKINNCKQLTSTDDKIQIHYRAVNLKNGREFDNSYYNNIPVKVHLGTRQFMKGWDIGLTGMCVGEIRNLTIPHRHHVTKDILTYPGGSPHPYVSDGDTLSFEIKLIKIEKDEL